ncbi:MAG: Gfo/Idh/MocA family oxidoreductase [Nitrospira sp.]|nr:Gfo/Idh/MocA family oxidoreductase [Nitrospira sp.]
MKKDFELIGIVGCGKMGRIYRQVFDPLCDRFLIVDPRETDNRETGPYATLDDVPGDQFNRVQVWCICTPTGNHFQSLETVLSRNPRARVIVEKPACLSFEVNAFRALLKKHREARVLINRQYADSRAVREMVHALKRYDVKHADLIRIEFSKDRRPDIDAGRFVDSHFGVLGYEWSHILTIIQQLLGENEWATYRDTPSDLRATFDPVQFISEFEERTVLPSGTKLVLRSSMLGHYEFASFVPYDQLICHRYIEVNAGAFRFRMQLEPHDETRFIGRLFENHFRIEDGGDVLHDTTILDPFLPRFLQLTLNQLFQPDCPPIDWTTLDRIISTRTAIRRHDGLNTLVAPAKTGSGVDPD